MHIGNYLGAINNWVKLQGKYDCVFSIVDLHAITAPYDIETLAGNTLAAANVYLAAGIDPAKSRIFVQSHLPHHAELTWLLNCVANMGELSRMTQFKDKAAGKGENVTVGLFDYPVLMAADILLYQTEIVPVGADQKQHVELARDLAVRFNNRFGETLKIPEAQISATGARIMGLDDPTKKMSKSASSPNNYIALTDDDQIIRKKIARAVTDSGTTVSAGPDKPALTNLLTIYSLFSGVPVGDLEARFTGRGYADFKQALAQTVVEGLAPFRQRLHDLTGNPDAAKQILASGAESIRPIAESTLREVKRKMGLMAK